MAYSLQALDRQLKNAKTSLKNIQDNLKTLRSSLDKAKRGSAQYQSLMDQISAAVEKETKQQQQIKTIENAITEAKASPFTTENVQTKKKLEDALARAQDKQDQAAIDKAQAALDAFTGGLTPVPQAKGEKVQGNVDGKLTTFEWKDNVLYLGGKPYNGTVTWSDNTTVYQDGKVTSRTQNKVKQPGLDSLAKTSGAMPEVPTGGPTEAAGPGFNASRVRAGEEKSSGATPPSTAFNLPVGAGIDELFAAAAKLYGGIDEIFKTNDELKALLTKAVGDPKNPKDDYTQTQFLNELQNTKWFKTNAGPIRQRGFYERQYNELVKGLKTDDPDYKAKIAELNKTSEWGRGLANAEESVREYVTKYLGINALDDTTIKSIASELYRYANEDDAVKIRNAVLGAAKYGKGSTIAGAAGENLTTLKSIAAANGFDLEKSFGTSIPTWLDNINKGESIETYKKIIRDAAKTAFNVNDRISALLDQGVDLSTIYKPYTNVMASVLEINPSEITLDDLSKKGVIGNKDQMNLYDFQRVLRKDPRWQYTQGARQEVSDSALNVLRDFGFQG